MVSRWAGAHEQHTSIRRLTRSQARRQQTLEEPTALRLRPLDAEDFVWPTIEEMRQVQELYRHKAPTDAQLDAALELLTVNPQVTDVVPYNMRFFCYVVRYNIEVGFC